MYGTREELINKRIQERANEVNGGKGVLWKRLSSEVGVYTLTFPTVSRSRSEQTNPFVARFAEYLR